MKDSEMLLKGANFLKNHHWVRGTRYATMNGIPTNMGSACRFCALGAIDKACDLAPFSAKFTMRGNLVNFNDFYAKNKMEVVEYMIKMAKELKAKGN